MDAEAEALEEKLVSLLGQLQAETAILERMVYKNKNQHRRGSYFQYLMKVRRDLRLLQSAKLEELLGCCFQSITGKRPKQKLHLLESLKRRKCESGKHNFMERLLGAARLLSQMVEPMLKAAIEISTLLARSFFMGFSLTVLALLARLRVLVQQILLDAVSVFNMVSSLSQTQQSVKIIQGGLEVFREFYPSNEEIIILECVWKSDKFELIERTHKTEIATHDGDLCLGESSVLYKSTESILGGEDTHGYFISLSLLNSSVHLVPGDQRVSWSAVAGLIPAMESSILYVVPPFAYLNFLHLQYDETIPETADANHSAEKVPIEVKEDKIDLMSGLSNDGDNSQLVEHCEDGPDIGENPSENFSEEGSLLTGTSLSQSSDASKLQSGPVKVAFIQVKHPLYLTANTTEIHSKENDISSSTKEDPLFSLLSGGNVMSRVSSE
ncbi:hypothetical protein DVH24_003430 [Malus domestica]|uniref:Nucleolus and neural progenitor protein-like N-terminal domain-containing protein n=2 Tax=Malus domestica TaxID=3750 RepID=A0A498ILT0_MALDO|nr:hypothetical protein DVH24_003430 [Malus domestica]